MKFIGLQENLKQGLQTVSHLVSKNINLPILNNILFRVQKGNIELIATNLEIGVLSRVRGKIESEGEFTVDSKVITEYINLLPSEKVEISENDGEIDIDSGNYKTKIKVQSAQDFPLLPVVPREKYYSVKIDDLRLGLGRVLFAVANNETRLELSGVLFVFNGDKLTVAGTDSYRLAEKEIKAINHGYGEDNKIIVPARTLQELLRILSSFREDEQMGSDGDIKIYFSENQILFAFGETELVSRLIVGNYPDYKQIIPSNSSTKIIIDKSELTRAIKASAIFSKSGVNDVNLEIKKDENKVIISSASGAVGQNTVELNAEVDGDDNSIAINYRYLIDGLNIIDDGAVKIEIINGNTPCLLRPIKESAYQYVVMPIRQ